jgi:hypothetical protein
MSLQLTTIWSNVANEMYIKGIKIVKVLDPVKSC